ncbi:restriction endonuclease subunit S [Bacteroides fragilis]|uniref:restriction endonuclease subunit S n=3 Tax=Bacteroides fragilis TaxID=817 RepID=UPI000CAC4F60|nr:restriction endonuclease subunit S [Bacteroides fragilis]MCE9434002.1 restriction endonuclease subunit S [Bacteroides fragilis]MCS2835773.1 restriction endonuclease subunit S [Bacteroides fragilis]PJY81685.1 type I restriction modification DNA specificity domain protein [Bacteroides fragilis]
MKNNKNNNCNFPTLRFPEFSGEWKKYFIRDIAEVTKGAGISKEQRSLFGTPCILYGELYTTYKSEVINDVQSKTDIDAKNLVRSKENDVIIPSSGETAIDISTARCVPYDDVLLGGDLNIIRLYQNDGRFLSYQLNGVRKLDIARVAQGSSVIHLYGESIKSLSVSLPALKEQQKIVSLLSLIDERIATQNKIIAHLESLIKGLTNQLLIPNSNWQPTTIGQVLTINPGKDYKHLKEGNIPVYGTGGYMLSVNDYLYDGESVCIGRKGTINKPIFLTGKFWTIDTLFYTSNFNSLLPRFGYYLFKTIDWLKYNEASGVPSLSKVSIEKIHISLPSLAIQNSICRLLDSIYDKLALEESVLNNHQTQKAFILQQMFI